MSVSPGVVPNVLATRYAQPKSMCSDRLSSNRKKMARARPTSAYWIGWIGSWRMVSNRKNATNVSTTNSKPYLLARSTFEYRFTGSTSDKPIASMLPAPAVSPRDDIACIASSAAPMPPGDRLLPLRY